MAVTSFCRSSRCSVKCSIRRWSTSLRLPVASPAWIRLTVDVSNTPAYCLHGARERLALAQALPQALAERAQRGLLQALAEQAHRFAGRQPAAGQVGQRLQERQPLRVPDGRSAPQPVARGRRDRPRLRAPARRRSGRGRPPR